MVAIREFETQPADLFSEVMFSLKRRLSLFVWQGFLEPLTFISFEANTLTIGAPCAFHRDWILTHYQIPLQEIGTEILGHPLKVSIISREGDYARKPPPPNLVSEPTSPSIRNGSFTPLKAPRQTPLETPDKPVVLESTQLNPAHTFEAFVTGPSNRM